MSYSNEQLNELTKNANEYFVETLDVVLKEYSDRVTLSQMRSIREKVFYTVFTDFIDMNEAEGNSYDFEQIGRLSYYLHASFQSTWLQYTR